MSAAGVVKVRVGQDDGERLVGGEETGVEQERGQVVDSRPCFSASRKYYFLLLFARRPARDFDWAVNGNNLEKIARGVGTWKREAMIRRKCVMIRIVCACIRGKTLRARPINDKSNTSRPRQYFKAKGIFKFRQMAFWQRTCVDDEISVLSDDAEDVGAIPRNEKAFLDAVDVSGDFHRRVQRVSLAGEESSRCRAL